MFKKEITTKIVYTHYPVNVFMGLEFAARDTKRFFDLSFHYFISNKGHLYNISPCDKMCNYIYNLNKNKKYKNLVDVNHVCVYVAFHGDFNKMELNESGYLLFLKILRKIARRHKIKFNMNNIICESDLNNHYLIKPEVVKKIKNDLRLRS